MNHHIKKKKELEKKHKTIKVDFEDTNIYKTIMNNYEEGPLKGLLKGLLHKKRIVIMFKKDRDNNEYGAKEYFRAVTKLLTDIGKKLKDKKIFVFFPLNAERIKDTLENQINSTQNLVRQHWNQ